MGRIIEDNPFTYRMSAAVGEKGGQSLLLTHLAATESVLFVRADEKLLAGFPE